MILFNKLIASIPARFIILENDRLESSHHHQVPPGSWCRAKWHLYIFKSQLFSRIALIYESFLGTSSYGVSMALNYGQVRSGSIAMGSSDDQPGITTPKDI